ncbi:predicted protein, partial [Nematostella vectensis]
SIVSYYSDAGEGNYGNIPVTGEVQVGLRYDYKHEKLEVQVHRARDIAPVDTKKKRSDPYLLPDKGRKSKRKTPTIRKNLNPQWNFPFTYDDVTLEELMDRSLELTVWDWDRGASNDFLGGVRLGMETRNYSSRHRVRYWFVGMCTMAPGVGRGKNKGEVYVTAEKVKRKSKRQSIASKGELHVHIMEAKNLPGKDADGMSDPFCKITLLPDKKGKTRHKTAIIKRTLNPSWDYNLIYEELSQEELRQRVLEISIWDHDIASRDEFLGGLRLGLGTSANEWDDSSKDEAQIWHTMLTRTNVWIQVVVPLR